jgi:hypothetical protein
LLQEQKNGAQALFFFFEGLAWKMQRILSCQRGIKEKG